MIKPSWYSLLLHSKISFLSFQLSSLPLPLSGAMCSRFLDSLTKCRAPIISYLFVSLISSLISTSSAACFNGNCQVHFNFFHFIAFDTPSVQTCFPSLKFSAAINSQVLEACSAAADCRPGLYCGNCPALGRKQPVCTRGQATIVTSIVSSYIT